MPRFNPLKLMNENKAVIGLNMLALVGRARVARGAHAAAAGAGRARRHQAGGRGELPARPRCRGSPLHPGAQEHRQGRVDTLTVGRINARCTSGHAAHRFGARALFAAARPSPPSPPPSGGIDEPRARPAQRNRNRRRPGEGENDHDRRPPKGPEQTTNGKHADRVYIFDTTLRDGEQSPGISLNVQEKLEIAHQLARLGVDIIEAGFPITSPGDFEAVEAIAKAVEGPVICGLARTVGAGHRRRLERGQALRAAAHPHLHRDLRHPHRAQAADHARGRDRPGARGGRARQAVLRRRRVLARGRQPLRRRVHGRGRARSRSTRARPRSTSPTPSATRCRTSTRRSSRELYRLVPELQRRRRLGPLPRRPRAGGRELVRRR